MDKKFINKWGVKEGDNRSELSKLKHPDEFSKQWWLITGIQWTNRAALVVGGSLVFIGQSDTENPHSQLYTQIGGVIAIASPFAEIVTSYINDQIYETKEKQWKEFVEDTKNLLNNYHELLGILERTEISEIGEVNKALNDLRNKAGKFLGKYDKIKNGRKNGVIDIDELINKEARKELDENLCKEDEGKIGNSQLGEIVTSIENLERKVNNYRQLRQEILQKEEENKDQKTTQKTASKQLEKQLKKAENDYKKTKKQLELKLIEEDKNEITKLKLELSKLEEKINNVKKQLVRNKLIDLENQFKGLVSFNYWKDKISHGRKETKKYTRNFAPKMREYLVAPAWYWEQWKNRNEQLIKKPIILDNDNCQEGTNEDKEIITELENGQEKEIQENYQTTIDLDKHFEEQTEAQVEITPK